MRPIAPCRAARPCCSNSSGARAPFASARCEPAVVALSAAVREAEAKDEFDVVLVQPGEMAPVAAAARAPTALFLPDSYSVQVRRARRAPIPWKPRLIAVLESLHVERWERRYYRSASALAAVSLGDADAIARTTGREVDVVPLALGDEWFVAPDRPRSPDVVTIVAALSYGPNVDGVVWFAREIWPLVRAEVPSARLRVVGRDPAPEVRAAVAQAGGELCADVPDTRPYYWEAAVVVVPLQLGSGVKTKVLNAFACSAPVVATPVAAEGIELESGRDVLIGADAPGVAAAIVASLADPVAATSRAERCRAIAELHRSERVAAVFEQFLERAAATAASRP